MEGFFEKDLFLELKDVSIKRNERVEISCLNWKIYNNQHWAIVGPVGAGKSLLAELILGSVHISGGEIHYTFITPEPSGYRNLGNNISYISFAENSSSFNYSRHYYQ